MRFQSITASILLLLAEGTAALATPARAEDSINLGFESPPADYRPKGDDCSYQYPLGHGHMSKYVCLHHHLALAPYYSGL